MIPNDDTSEKQPPTYQRIALLGGVYNNHLALGAAVTDARRRGVEAIFALGDLGAFGPYPDRVFPIIGEHQIPVVRGNYDDSIGFAKNDCQCGYTDARDNYFAQLSYDYTLAQTSDDNRTFLRSLPLEIRIRIGEADVLLCHGSPRRMNEFLWQSTSSTAFLSMLCQTANVDAICATHTGLKWTRRLPGDRLFVNVGVLGRPENDGTTNVWYTILSWREESAMALSPARLASDDAGPGRHLQVEFVPVVYDYQRLAREMADERLPSEFIATIMTGWWTTCLEVLPAKERRRGPW